MARAGSQNSRSASLGSGGSRILGMPERLAVPLITFAVMALLLTAFGCVMIYSASSVTAVQSAATNYDAAYYVKHQLVPIGLGLGLAAVFVMTDYHGKLFLFGLYALWIVTVLLLVAVLTPVAGQDAYGATRWISVGGFTLQPSEFAKVTIVLTAANIFDRHYRTQELDDRHFILALLLFVGVPMLLILVQPDKGTTIIIALALFVMLMLAGEDWHVLAVLAALGAAAALFLTFKDDYSRQRLLTMLDPWQDYYGSGWQLIQGFYAFASGGLFGVGLGLSRQKYSYLPFAYNDFIFAVVGEELGLVGTLGLLAAFGVLVWAGYRIARNAPDLCGRLIAAGVTSLIWIQLAVNVCGVLGLIPLSGKPVPFVSYGGSSIASCLMLVGLVVMVSVHSWRPDAEREERRRSLRVASDDRVDVGLSSAGEAHPRSDRYRLAPLTVVEGGAAEVSSGGASRRGRGGSSAASAERRRRPVTTSTARAGGYTPVRLGPSAAERLRPQTRTSRSGVRERSGRDW